MLYTEGGGGKARTEENERNKFDRSRGLIGEKSLENSNTKINEDKKKKRQQRQEGKQGKVKSDARQL